MTPTSGNTSDQPGNNGGGIVLNDVIIRLEQFKVGIVGFQEFCDEHGIVYDETDIHRTFQRIQEVVHQLKLSSKHERNEKTKLENEKCELQSKLEQIQKEKELLDQKVAEQERELKEFSEMKIQYAGLKLDYDHLQSRQSRLFEDMEEEKNRIRRTVENDRLDAEHRLRKTEDSKRRIQIDYHDVLAQNSKQKELLSRANRQNSELKDRLLDLEREKDNTELRLSNLLLEYDENRVRDDFDERFPSAKTSRYKDLVDEELEEREGQLSDQIQDGAVAETSLNCYSRFDHNWQTRNPSLLPKESRNFTDSLVLPRLSSTHQSGNLSNYHRQGSSTEDRVRENPNPRLEGQLYRNQQKWSSGMEIPPSVVSGPAFNNSFHRNNGQICFGDNSPLLLNSCTSDSATADDLTYDHYQSTIGDGGGVNSYDFNGSSSVPYTDDFDSVNDSSLHFSQHPHHRGINPLQWAWRRKGNVLGGVQNVARTGSSIAKSAWTWLFVGAAAAGTAGLAKRELSDVGECSETEEEEQEEEREASSSNHPSSTSCQDLFVGSFVG